MTPKQTRPPTANLPGEKKHDTETEQLQFISFLSRAQKQHYNLHHF